MARNDLMDQEWAMIGPLLPPERGRWAEQVVWDALLQTLVDLGLIDGGICSTAPWFVRIRRPLAQKEAHVEAFGRSRGGLTSKIHTQCDNQGHPLGFVLTRGQISDYKATDALMKLPVPNPKAMLDADRSGL